MMASGYAKVSVTLPAQLVDRIRARVGARGVSRYVAHALEAEERREALRAWLSGQDAAHGPVPDEAMQEVRRQWLADADPDG
jgi:post-segregation antitoxin (ccd killing protein)